MFLKLVSFSLPLIPYYSSVHQNDKKNHIKFQIGSRMIPDKKMNSMKPRTVTLCNLQIFLLFSIQCHFSHLNKILNKIFDKISGFSISDQKLLFIGFVSSPDHTIEKSNAHLDRNVLTQFKQHIWIYQSFCKKLLIKHSHYTDCARL